MFKKKVFINIILLIAITCAFPACKSNDDIRMSKNPEITGIIAPVTLNTDSTILELSDFFRHPKMIDSVFVDKSLSYRITPDSSRIIITVKNKPAPRQSVMTVFVDGYPYSILLQRTSEIWHHFVFDPKDKDYKKVEITGEMNDWRQGKTFLKLRDGKWQTDLYLVPGKYEYQLIIDGKMMPDPSNPEKTEGYTGGWNSVLHAGNINPPGTPYLYTLDAEKDHISIGIKNKATEIFVFWQNYQLDSTFWKPDSAGISIRIPRKAKDLERSFIRVFANNQSGVSNQVLVPVNNGKVLTNASDITRNDKEAMIIYFLMTDRFMNGNTNNDQPVRDSLVDRRLNFQGGDISGILKKIEDGYFKKLGVNTLWISPLVQNPQGAWPDYMQSNRRSAGYHGYWPVSLSAVDKRFGTADELKSLSEEAHSNDLNIILDLVVNRIHKESPIFTAHPEWLTPMTLPESKTKNIRLWREQPYTTWWEEYLPTLDLSNPDVQSMMSDSALFWLKAYELDGFRYDAVNHVPDEFISVLTKKIRENVVIPDNRQLFQIGECYESRQKTIKYTGAGKFDAVFDINLYAEAGKTFSRDNASFKDLGNSLRESMNCYGDHSLAGNISGNQDLPRFISYASGDLVPGEDYIKAGWDRKIKVSDTNAYAKLAMLNAFNLTVPGVPVIYYGDEIGMPGAGEPDNRRMMKFDSLSLNESALFETVCRLTSLRRNSLPLIYGDLKPMLVTDKVMVYMRSYFNKVAFVIFNKNRTSEDITIEIPQRFRNSHLKGNFGNNFDTDKNSVKISLRGLSFEILTN